MALKAWRDEAVNGASVNIDFFMNGTGEAGSIVKFVTTTTGVGSAFDDSNALVALPTVLNGSGEAAAGILLCDVVNKDLSQTHTNAHKREVNIGGKVGVGRGGIWTTNRVIVGYNPSAGAPAYFTAGGLLTNTAVNENVGGDINRITNRVGTFLSAKDADGYVKVAINL